MAHRVAFRVAAVDDSRFKCLRNDLSLNLNLGLIKEKARLEFYFSLEKFLLLGNLIILD